MKIHLALFLTVFLLNARAETLLLVGGISTLTIPAGKAVLFTGSFGGDCVPGGAAGTPCGSGVAVTASVQAAARVFAFPVSDSDSGLGPNRIVAGPATVTFTNSNAAVTYRFVTGVSSVTLEPRQTQTISVPARKSLKTLSAFDGSTYYYVDSLRLRITQNGRTVEVPYTQQQNNELSGPITVEVVNDSATKGAVFVYSIIRPSLKLP